MAHFAKIENDTVVEVIVADQEFIDLQEGEWVQTSYNTKNGAHTQGGTPFRKNFAAIGFVYDRQLDAFIQPKPFDSWVLNVDECQWYPPTPMPTDGKLYQWNEKSLSWVEHTKGS